MTKVVVALSGGVDSSVAAALLVKQGYEVVGATMRLWSAPGCEEENRCCTPQTRQLAAQLAQQLGIPFQILDAQEAFRQAVVQRFLGGYRLGETPNPCVYCNRYLKWDYLWQFAQSIGAEAIATGHYARLRRSTDGTYELWKGVDATKDQTYFLSCSPSSIWRIHSSRLGSTPRWTCARSPTHASCLPRMRWKARICAS